jgi:hypothetical protein
MCKIWEVVFGRIRSCAHKMMMTGGLLVLIVLRPVAENGERIN